MKKLILALGLGLLITSAAYADKINDQYGVGVDVDVLRVGAATIGAEGRYIPDTDDVTLFAVAKFDLTNAWAGPAVE